MSNSWNLKWVWRALLICALLLILLPLTGYVITYLVNGLRPPPRPVITPDYQFYAVSVWSPVSVAMAVLNVTLLLESILAILWMPIGVILGLLQRHRRSPTFNTFAFFGGLAVFVEVALVYIGILLVSMLFYSRVHYGTSPL